MPPKDANDPQPQAPRPVLRRMGGALVEASRAGLGWAAVHRIGAVLIGAAGVASLGGLILVALLLAARPPATELPTVEQALEALDDGAYPEAAQRAKTLLAAASLPAAQRGGPLFVLGATAAYEAEAAAPPGHARRWLVAARYLEEAYQHGFPPEREAEGIYLLGLSLYSSGQFAACRPILQEAQKLNPRRASEVHRLLAGAYLNDAEPNLPRALEENAAYLADPGLPPAARQRGLVQRARILRRQGNLSECAAALKGVSPTAESYADALVVRAEVLLEEARALEPPPQLTDEQQAQRKQMYAAALQTLREAESRDTLGSQATRKAMYLIGVCFLETGEPRAALKQFERTRIRHAGTPEEIAASFHEGELLRQMGQDQEALLAYGRVLSAVTDPEKFSNPWLSREQLRKAMLAAVQHYLAAQDFESALQLVRRLHPLFARARALELMAEVYHAWGKFLLAQAERLPHAKAEAQRRVARDKSRQAGRVYWRLAQLQAADPQYPEHLWNSAAAYLEGQDYRNAAAALQKYLEREPRRRRPQALLRLGEALLAANQPERALQSFQECTAVHPRDAAAYRARLLASRIFLEKGDRKQAETLLRENLNGEDITPASKEWRDSLFALGELLHQQQRYQEAIDRLDEAVRRDGDHPRATEARYLIAEAYRRSAQALRDQRAQASPGTYLPGRASEVDERFEKALEAYRHLQEELAQRRDPAELSPAEKAMLRNAHFAVGSILFELGRFEAAIQTYSAASDRYRHCPEVLEAYVQMASAYQQLNKPIEARSTLAQAKVVLARMNPDAPFTETTLYSRKQWSDLLDSLSKQWAAGGG